jgi:hypothetical protein
MTAPRRRNTPAHVGGLVEALERSFAEALRSPEGIAEPVALLWTDADPPQWQALVDRLQTILPQVFVLGPYAADKRTGPAIWLRCLVDRALPEVQLAAGVVPILYLPGVGRQDLRAGEDCPPKLQPLVELQFRGRVWHQRNGRDWTVEAFLASEDGLGLDVAQDARTKEAALRSLPLLAETSLEGLRGHRLEADDFDRLAVSDPARDVLRWMSAGDAFRGSEGEDRWKAFRGLCVSDFKLDPDDRSPADAAAALLDGNGKWDLVWRHFKDSPRLYPDVAQLLRHTATPLQHRGSERDGAGNDTEEKSLRNALDEVQALPHKEAIARVRSLEARHGKRRDWLWAELGASTLALALEPLARLAEGVGRALGGTTLDGAVVAYVKDGWRVDRAAIEALARVKSAGDSALVGGVVRALYLPWLDESARHFQALVRGAENSARAMVTGTEHEKDACLLFADGLRFDVACMLRERLEAKGLKTSLRHRLAPLPTVTATAKPFATVVYDRLEGGEDILDFNPRIKESPQAANAQRLRDELAARGFDLLGDELRPAKSGTVGGWIEAGRLDDLGHKLDARLVTQVDAELAALVDQVTGLIECGWMRIRIVTDHGWLLMPGGLPQVALPTHLTATKWARCATVKGDARPDVPVYAWHWNPHVRIASPPGIGSFAANTEYAHGGVSPQECIVPELVVERGGASASASIASITWLRMRCRVAVTTNDPRVRVDLRLHWKQAGTSIAASVKEVGPAGEASLAVADDSHDGRAANVVILDAAGNVLDHKPTTVGENP